MRLGAALAGALLTTLATPATWPLALATFLLRGGILLVLLPIVVLPSPVGLGNLLAPILLTVVLGGLTVEVVAIVTAAVLALVGWVVLGGLIAASLEIEAARIVAHDEEHSGVVRTDGAAAWATDRALAGRVAAVRLVAHVPTGVGLSWGSVRLVEVAYAELTRPVDVATPIALRVLAGAPGVVVLVAIAWAFGEVVGALATRRIALDGVTAVVGLREALRVTLQHPLKVTAAFAVPSAGLGFVLITSSVAAAVAWSAVRVAMRPPGELLLGTLAVLLFVSLWVVGLLLVAVTTAWRAAVWSVAHHDLWPARSSSRSVEPV